VASPRPPVQRAETEPPGAGGNGTGLPGTNDNGTAPRSGHLSPERKALAAKHVGLVGLHLRHHLPRYLFTKKHREYSDLFQEGCLALIRSAITYDPDCDGPFFQTYALPRIRGTVCSALQEQFRTIRVPARARKADRAKLDDGGVARVVIQELTSEMAEELAAGDSVGQDEETIHDLIRERYQRSVRLALAELRRKPWRQRNPIAIMERVAEERLLVPRECGQASVRQIARDFGVSKGRVSAYERNLLEVVRRHFGADPQVPLLVRFAREDELGFAGRMDAERRWRLTQADLQAFAEHYADLPRSAKAELVYEMIERSATAVSEVACNLYRLTADREPAPIANVA
jgi:RNA polymerase sigma factor (sigma-70 family)